MNQADMTAILVELHVRELQGGLGERLRYAAFGVGGDAGLGELAKRCGVSKGVLRSWEDGASMPTTNEGARWLKELYEAQPRPYSAGLHDVAAAAARA